MKWFSDQVVWARGSLREGRHLPHRIAVARCRSDWGGLTQFGELGLGQGDLGGCDVLLSASLLRW
jgi:hypothetical protein